MRYISEVSRILIYRFLGLRPCAAGALRSLNMILMMALALLLADGRSAHAQDQLAGVVVKLSGSASVERGGVTITLQLGDAIIVGDRLETALDSALGVTLRDNSLLSLGPSSAFELTGFELDPVGERFSIGGRIVYGSMAVTTGEIGKIAPENVVFETPFGVIGIRGTKFAVSII